MSHLGTELLASILRQTHCWYGKGFFTLRLSAQPARRPGSPKCIYSAPLQIEDVQIDENGDVTVSIIADDIYSKNSTQRYQITLTEAEISILAHGVRPHKALTAG